MTIYATACLILPIEILLAFCFIYFSVYVLEQRVLMDSQKDKRNILQRFRDLIVLASTYLSNLSKLSKYHIPISEYIDLQPVETTNLEIIGQVTDLNDSKVIGKISKKSITYKILLVFLYSIFYILPIVIIVMTLIYIIPLFDIRRLVKEKKFFNDVIIYRELDKIYSILGIYVNDYILYMTIVCIVYAIILLYLFFSKFIKTKEPGYGDFITRIYFLVVLTFVTILIHFIYNYDKIQRMGRLRDRLIKMTGDRINTEYILFLVDESKSGKKDAGDDTGDEDILELNNVDILARYITGLLIELKTQTAPSDITLMSVEQFKSYRNDKKESFYDLILNAIITYSLILNISNNHYNEGDVKQIDKNFFMDKKSLLLTINFSTNNLMEIHSQKCIEKVLDGKGNKSPFMISICRDAKKINDEMNNCIIDIKNTTNHYIFPPQMITTIFVAIICIIYCYSFVVKVNEMNSQDVQTAVPVDDYQPDPYQENGMY